MYLLLRKIFAPLLNIFEKGEGEYLYKPSYRLILMVMGALFTLLACGSLALVIAADMFGGLLPGVVFLTVGTVCLVVGALGTDAAVARIWKNK
ncbi:hypothetical protein [Oceanobacter mangrovi]|uniref:hypothetical protein n=1 Tax=Oceanobacter mangrovi TaxID=2862510 RepID=UPI001C8DF637|nr:hypothetical protein [Oceanobacter mangrovi]